MSCFLFFQLKMVDSEKPALAYGANQFQRQKRETRKQAYLIKGRTVDKDPANYKVSPKAQPPQLPIHLLGKAE